MAEIVADTSSYPKPPALPVQKDALDQMQQFGALKQQQQQIESGGIQIEKQKLDLANQRFGQMAKMFTALAQDPQLDLGKITKGATDLVKLGIVPDNMAATFLSTLPNTQGMPPQQAAATLKKSLEQHVAQAGTIMEAINTQYGNNATINDNKQIIPITTSPIHGIRQTSAPLPVQQGPQTPIFNEQGEQRYQGVTPPQGAPGMATGFPPMPGSAAPQKQPVIRQPSLRNALPVENDTGTPANESLPQRITTAQQNIENSAPRGPLAAPPPGFAEGMKMRTEDQLIASGKMMAVKPIENAIKIIDKGGFSTGPVTGKISDMVAALKALGVVDIKNENDPTVLRQELEKNLAKYVAGSSLAARSDAAQILAQASNPDPNKHLLPALRQLAVEAIALDRVQAAMPNVFTSGEMAKYGEHKAKFPRSIDERAFTLDKMPKAEAQKLVKDMHSRYERKPNDPEALKFFKSLDIAKKQGFFSGADLE